MKQNLRFYALMGVYLLLAGVLFGSGHLIAHFQPKAKPAFNTSISQAPAKKATISGTPMHITIPSANISVDVQPGYYNKQNQTWTLSTTEAQYATITSKANNAGGNTFIYGHNRPSVFSRLLKVQPGDEAVVTTDNHHVFTYKMTDQRITKPTDDSLFRYQGPPILTLQTCSGLWYQNRSLFIFNLVEVA